MKGFGGGVVAGPVDGLDEGLPTLLKLVDERRKVVRLGHHGSSICDICGANVGSRLRYRSTRMPEEGATTTGTCGQYGGHRLCINTYHLRW